MDGQQHGRGKPVEPLLWQLQTKANIDIEKAADVIHSRTRLYQFLAIIPLQLFGYYVSVGKGCDADKPV